MILAVDAVRQPLTGIGRYVYELARHLPQIDPSLDLRLFAGARFIGSLSLEEVVRKALSDGVTTAGQGVTVMQSGSAADGIRRRVRRLRDTLQASTLARRAHHAWLARRQARVLAGQADAVYHGPQFYLPSYAGPAVATVHDLSVFHWAHCHPRGRVALLRREIRTALERARLIITDSEFTRRELATFFDVSDDRIRAVPLAAGTEFHPRQPAELAAALQALGLRVDGYCLFAGTIEPRKNIVALIDAYRMLPAALRTRFPLVLTGYRGWRSEVIHARIAQAADEGWLRYLGYLPARTLPLLFAGARLFAFPSHYEGFGLPVLEAMASGVPVVCSTSSSLPEVAGGAAAGCPPEAIDTLAVLLERGLDDADWRAHARIAGLANAARYSWRRCAGQTLAVYREAAARAS